MKKRLVCLVVATLLAFSAPLTLAADSILRMDQIITPLEFNMYLEEQLPKTSAEWSIYIQESDCIDYNTDTIQAIAAQITAQNFSTQKEQLYAAYTHAGSHLIYQGGTSQTISASEALANGYGDCDQYAYVTVAIANALNIPCMIISARTAHDTASAHLFQSGCTLLEALEAKATHNFIIAYADGQIVRLDPTWGRYRQQHSSDVDKYFDMSIEQISTSHMYVMTRRPGHALVIKREYKSFTISPAKLEVDGRPVLEFKAIIHENSHYLPLRDTAVAIGTYALNREKQFSVAYNTKEWGYGVPGIALHAQYIPNGDEFSYEKLQGASALGGQIPISVNGVLKMVDSILVDGTNYIKMRDVLAICDINVEWVPATQTIRLDSSSPYIAP